MKQPLFCVDCKWHISHSNTTPAMNLDRCKASETFNLVTGEPKYSYCETMRSALQPCGMDAKLFELNVSDVETELETNHE